MSDIRSYTSKPATLALQVPLLLIACLLASCSEPPSELDKVLAVGELRVATTNDATTYYIDRDGAAGLEYELAKGLAQTLGVRLSFVVPPNFSDILRLLDENKAHIAAAGLTVTGERARTYSFGPTYHVTRQQVVYRRGETKPDSINALSDGKLHVLAGSSYEEKLRELRLEHPKLTWTARDDVSVDELAQAVINREIDYTVIDSHRLNSLRGLHPELNIAFALSGPQTIAWAMSKHEDDSLQSVVSNYFNQLRESGELERLLEQHFRPAQKFDYVDARLFLRHRDTRLPEYEPLFKKAEADTGFDWRLLAAMSYQESHWQPQARSPTGVRGLMMLTRATAKRMGVKDRIDPEQSISAGAAYLREMADRLPERIAEPDRTWMALAAYNVGLGHLEDARKLVQADGGDPDRWRDVRDVLPLLTKQEWYRKTRYGFARGHEPVRYVQNIRRYYDVLSQAAANQSPDQIVPVRRRYVKPPSPVL